jgi:hypothetical protein
MCLSSTQLAPLHLGLLIEIWKITKAMDVSVDGRGLLLAHNRPLLKPHLSWFNLFTTLLIVA